MTDTKYPPTLIEIAGDNEYLKVHKRTILSMSLQVGYLCQHLEDLTGKPTEEIHDAVSDLALHHVWKELSQDEVNKLTQKMLEDLDENGNSFVVKEEEVLQ